MIAHNCISYDVPQLSLSSKGDDALNGMDDLKVSHLPVVENNKLLGMVSEDAILDMESSDLPLKQVGNWNPVHVLSHQHIFEIIKVVAEANLSVVPVLDADGNYEGSIIGHEMLLTIANMSVIREPGSVLVLELNARDYSLTEVSNIVESDGAKILGSFVTSTPDSTQLELTLKINKPNLSAIISTFERYQYSVVRSFDQGDHYDDLKKRYASLMNYLNV